MKFLPILLFFLLSSFLLNAQENSALSGDNDEKKDSLKEKSLPRPLIPPRVLIIKLKDAGEINKNILGEFKIIEDASHFTSEELASGLSDEELKGYKKNKNELQKIIQPPEPEEKAYPEILTLRKILGAAKTAGLIIILILSLVR